MDEEIRKEKQRDCLHKFIPSIWAGFPTTVLVEVICSACGFRKNINDF